MYVPGFASVCRKAPGVYNVAMTLPSSASISNVTNNVSFNIDASKNSSIFYRNNIQNLLVVFHYLVLIPLSCFDLLDDRIPCFEDIVNLPSKYKLFFLISNDRKFSSLVSVQIIHVFQTDPIYTEFFYLVTNL